MPYRGRYTLGQTLPLRVLCTDQNGTPGVPTAAPRLAVWNAGGNLVLEAPMPVLDRYGQAGLFGYPLFLGSLFAPGNYTVEFNYTVGSHPMVETDNFEVGAGGDANGAVISMYFYLRPQANYVVQQLESSRTPTWGRNPTV